MRIERRAFRAALLPLAIAPCLAAGCPFRQSDRAPGAEAWTEEVFLRVGESAGVDGGRLDVTVLTVEAGSRIGTVAVRLATDGRSSDQELEVVRNAPFSEAARLEPYVVRVLGYPGVDSARLQITREGAPPEPQ